MKLRIDQSCQKVIVAREDIPFDRDSVFAALNDDTHVEFRNSWDWVRIYSCKESDSGRIYFAVSDAFESYDEYDSFEDAWNEFKSDVERIIR